MSGQPNKKHAAMRFLRSRRRQPEPDQKRILVDIGRLLRVASEMPEADDAALIAALISAGVEPRMARRLVMLVPIAFGRVALAELGVVESTTYIAQLPPDFHSVSKDLRAEPEYRAAADHISDFAPQPGFAAVAGRSAEIDAASRALSAGEDIAAGRLWPPTITWPDPGDDG